MAANMVNVALAHYNGARGRDYPGISRELHVCNDRLCKAHRSCGSTGRGGLGGSPSLRR
jgi:hypothetical protein